MAQLEWVGQQFRTAIGSYYESSPGGAKTYPKRLEDLLDDRRHVVPRHHLRQVYRNPFTGVADWDLLRSTDGRIYGVRVAMHRIDRAAPLLVDYAYLPE